MVTNFMLISKGSYSLALSEKSMDSSSMIGLRENQLTHSILNFSKFLSIK